MLNLLLMKNHLENILKKSLIEFAKYVRNSNWKGRERETVSFFVTGFLSKYVKKGTLFYDLSQVIIEGAVSQMPSCIKKHCNKDLLIWPRPGMTCWNHNWEPVKVPLAIMEWKVHRPKTKSFNTFHKHDLQWLSWFTSKYSGTIGLTVALDLSVNPFLLYAAFCKKGKQNLQWLKC
ncbi:MAG: hypothetical protein ABH952_08465 [Candidatus Omnitrophota bacterium]